MCCGHHCRFTYAQRRLGLGQPECHVHGTVEGEGSRKCSTDLVQPWRPGTGSAEAAVAVGLERAHAQLFGQGESLLVMSLGLRPAEDRLHGMSPESRPA